MGFAILLGRLSLALIFAVAGITKFFDLQRSRTAVSDFGVPEWLASPLGIALPYAEICVAGLLLPVETVWWGALGSTVLLLAFAAGIIVNLARGKRPECNCFGQLHSKPIGPSTLARVAFLSLISTLILSRASYDPGASLGALLDANRRDALVGAIGALLAMVTCIQSWLTIHTLRQNGRLLLRIEALEASGSKAQARVPLGLPVGLPAPSFELANARGGAGSLADLLRLGKPVLLVFSDANCGPCKAMRPDLSRWERDHAAKLTIAIITRGERPDKIARDHDLKFVYIQNDREIASKYQVAGTPAAVLITADNVVASPLAQGAQAIAELVSLVDSGSSSFPVLIHGARPASQNLPIGAPAPLLTLPDLTGKAVSLAGYRGRKIIIVFWNPGCGFCARMVPDIKDWELTRNGSGPQMVLIAAGTTEQNAAMSLRSPVLLDQNRDAMRAFGASGTPSAIMIDESGHIASNLVAGAAAIFAVAKTTDDLR